uniref:G protein-coupled receptor n=1 Tax=Pristionchus pacificus TaxID=54126 RepID=A0A8R1YMN8_PRIPA
MEVNAKEESSSGGALHVTLTAQSGLLLATSFAYRLWVLKTAANKKPTANIENCSKFSLGILAALMIFKSDRTEEPAALLIYLVVYPITFSLDFPFGTYSRTSSCFPRRLLAEIGGLSYSDRQGHHQIYRSLRAQMMLPLASVSASSLWFLDVFGIMTSLFAFVSPLINIYFIPPYRKYLKVVITGHTRVMVKVSGSTQQSESKI